MGKDLETLPAVCHASFVGLDFINKNSPSCELLKSENAEQEPNRQRKRPGLRGLRSTREGGRILWRIAYKRGDTVLAWLSASVETQGPEV